MTEVRRSGPDLADLPSYASRDWVTRRPPQPGLSLRLGGRWGQELDPGVVTAWGDGSCVGLAVDLGVQPPTVSCQVELTPGPPQLEVWAGDRLLLVAATDPAASPSVRCGRGAGLVGAEAVVVAAVEHALATFPEVLFDLGGGTVGYLEGIPDDVIRALVERGVGLADRAAVDRASAFTDPADAAGALATLMALLGDPTLRLEVPERFRDVESARFRAWVESTCTSDLLRCACVVVAPSVITCADGGSGWWGSDPRDVLRLTLGALPVTMVDAAATDAELDAWRPALLSQLRRMTWRTFDRTAADLLLDELAQTAPHLVAQLRGRFAPDWLAAFLQGTVREFIVPDLRDLLDAVVELSPGTSPASATAQLRGSLLRSHLAAMRREGAEITVIGLPPEFEGGLVVDVQEAPNRGQESRTELVRRVAALEPDAWCLPRHVVLAVDRESTGSILRHVLYAQLPELTIATRAELPADLAQREIRLLFDGALSSASGRRT